MKLIYAYRKCETKMYAVNTKNGENSKKPATKSLYNQGHYLTTRSFLTKQDYCIPQADH